MSRRLRHLWRQPAGRLAIIAVIIGALLIVGVITWVPLLYLTNLRGIDWTEAA